MHLSSIETGSWGTLRVNSCGDKVQKPVTQFTAPLGVYIPQYLLSHWLPGNRSSVAEYPSQVHELSR